MRIPIFRVAFVVLTLLGQGAMAARPTVLQRTTKLRADQAENGVPADSRVPTTRRTKLSGARRTDRLAREMRDTIRQHDTPSFEVVPTARGATMRLVSAPHPTASRNDAVPVYEVRGIMQPDTRAQVGILLVDAFLPVSGHVQPPARLRAHKDPSDYARKFAKTNTYRLWVQHEDHTVTTLPKISARGLVTKQQIALTLKPGRNVVYFGVGDGEAVPPAFLEGRSKVLLWDGK